MPQRGSRGGEAVKRGRAVKPKDTAELLQAPDGSHAKFISVLKMKFPPGTELFTDSDVHSHQPQEPTELHIPKTKGDLDNAINHRRKFQYPDSVRIVMGYVPAGVPLHVIAAYAQFPKPVNVAAFCDTQGQGHIHRLSIESCS